MANYLLQGIDKLARRRRFRNNLANTPHIVFDGLRRSHRFPLISIVEATRVSPKMQNLNGSPYSGRAIRCRQLFITKVFARDGIELLVPDLHDQDTFHDKYMNELVPGKFSADTRDSLLAIVDSDESNQRHRRSDSRRNRATVILRDPIHNGIPFLDTTKIMSKQPSLRCWRELFNRKSQIEIRKCRSGR